MYKICDNCDRKKHKKEVPLQLKANYKGYSFGF